MADVSSASSKTPVMDHTTRNNISSPSDERELKKRLYTELSHRFNVVGVTLPSPPLSPVGPKKRHNKMKNLGQARQNGAPNDLEGVYFPPQDSGPRPRNSRASPPAPIRPLPHPISLPAPPPPPPPPETAQYLAERINRLFNSLLLTIGDTLKGVINVLSFAFVLLQKPMTQDAPLADYSELLALQSRLENVVEMQGDYSLTHSIRKTDVVMRDLTAQLRVSELASKDALVRKMESFTADAQDATRGLQRLSSRVGGSLDTIIAMDDFALKRLERIERGGFGSGSTIFNMIMLRKSDSIRREQRRELALTFERASEVTAEQLERLVTEAEVVLMLLNRLDGTQETLHEMILAENKVVKREGEELVGILLFHSLTEVIDAGPQFASQLAQLWTILGGNKNEVALFMEHRDLLAQMSRYRSTARDRVQTTIDQLHKLSEDLSDLRDRVARPALVGADGVVPLEVHLDGLRRGVEKLEAFRNQDLINSPLILIDDFRGNEKLRQMIVEPLPKSHQIGDPSLIDYWRPAPFSTFQERVHLITNHLTPATLLPYQDGELVPSSDYVPTALFKKEF
ncbi:hypothetical protein DL93DRAFT_2159145 [Clavulina sp. PMI_390]|nr:hypothetical protein DL93DRAFT_2159145 [Clavulina sp. PMI_390]